MDSVITRLMGGLGNQMFQYATGLAVARRLGVPLLLDRTFLDSRPPEMNWTPRDVELDVFPIPIAFADERQVERIRRELDERWYRVARRLLPGLFPRRCMVQRGTGYDLAVFTHQAPLYLEGFWQNERYFLPLAGELREKAFVPKEAPSADNTRLLDAIKSGNSASIHIRRGDYVENPEASGYHGTCSLEYYTAAAKLLAEEQGVDRFFVFSDDPEWARTNLDLPRPVTVVGHNTGRESHWDLFLMRHCRHYIIANSSFSWWGAWLNPSEDKVVIAPKTWFKGTGTPASDIIPPGWTAR